MRGNNVLIQVHVSPEIKRLFKIETAREKDTMGANIRNYIKNYLAVRGIKVT